MVEVLRRRPSPSLSQPATKAEVRPSLAAKLVLPPRIPRESAELDEAIMLLGSYVQTGGAMRKALLDRLLELVGILPRPADASKWKSALKKLRAELR